VQEAGILGECPVDGATVAHEQRVGR
jgi:hypothetical protein